MTSPRHHLEATALKGARALLVRLPERVARAVGSGIGWCVGTILGVRRATVRRNLELAFPDRSAAWRRGVARRAWMHLGREAVAALRLSAETPEAIRARSEYEGEWTAFDRRVAEGKGVVVVTGHIGSWEIAGAAVAARGHAVDAVAVRQRNPLVDRELAESRRRLGMQVIPRHEAPRRILAALRAGRVAGIVGDQNVAFGGIFVDFMGHAASTARGAAVFALRTGAPLFAGVALALPGAEWRYRVIVHEVDVERSGDFETDVHRLTQAHTHALERVVRDHPEQYFWLHRRWKRREIGS
ncbi:MAG: lysophospholipid acyltransferase family protein [Longimicrobiales bacterium]|nr:lysophospholipid acyltransferase family protein [Longimicrobiales bacterium]